jgi:uncharacterized lipoprotein
MKSLGLIAIVLVAGTLAACSSSPTKTQLRTGLLDAHKTCVLNNESKKENKEDCDAYMKASEALK